jgi:hypothetical protein
MENKKSFTVCLKTKYSYSNLEICSSGPANDWTELIIHCIRWSRKARYYLAEEVLFKYPNRFQEYLIDCTSAEVNTSSYFFLIYF